MKRKLQPVKSSAPSARPNCPCCGRPLALNSDYHFFPPGEEPDTLEECRRRFNGRVTAVSWGMARKRTESDPAVCTIDPSRPRVITSCNVWTGSYGGYPPFCTLRCAGDFARAAHRAGYRVTK